MPKGKAAPMTYLVTFSEEGDSQPFTTPDGLVYIRRVPGAYFLIDDLGRPLTGGLTLDGCVSVLRVKMFPTEQGMWSEEDRQTNGGMF